MSSVRLLQGDCLTILPTLADVQIDAIITDPPYLTDDAKVPVRGNGVGKHGRTKASESVGNPWGYNLDWIEACARFQPKHWIVYANFKMLGGLCTALERHANIANVFVWRKNNAPRMTRPVPRFDCEFIVWARTKGSTCGRMGEFDSSLLDVPMLQAGCFATERMIERTSGKSLHPCQKPLAVVRPFIDRLPIQSVLDPYMGTGTTGSACIQTGRNFIGIELDEAYFCIASKRIADAQLQPRLFEAETPRRGARPAALDLFADTPPEGNPK